MNFAQQDIEVQDLHIHWYHGIQNDYRIESIIMFACSCRHITTYSAKFLHCLHITVSGWLANLKTTS